MMPERKGKYMSYLSKEMECFEPRTLRISYPTRSGNGVMNINVHALMEEQTVVKIRKLVNIIRTSNTPDAEQVIANYCKQWLSQYDAEQKALANAHVAAKEKARGIEIDIVYNQRARERYKRNTEPYKHYSELLKQKRKELSAANSTARTHQTEFNRNQRMKEKYEKVLEIWQ